jgi:hypothetical protein
VAIEDGDGLLEGLLTGDPKAKKKAPPQGRPSVKVEAPQLPAALAVREPEVLRHVAHPSAQISRNAKGEMAYELKTSPKEGQTLQDSVNELLALDAEIRRKNSTT